MMEYIKITEGELLKLGFTSIGKRTYGLGSFVIRLSFNPFKFDTCIEYYFDEILLESTNVETMNGILRFISNCVNKYHHKFSNAINSLLTTNEHLYEYDNSK